MSGQNQFEGVSEYDLILVGAGSASCLIASRLSKLLPSYRFLVLEAGGDLHNDPSVLTPGLSATLQSKPLYDWQYASAPEPALNHRIVKHPRGKLVGGTSATNSHSVVYPSYEWHDRIAEELLPEAGRGDWSSKGMQECYKRWQMELSKRGLKDKENSRDHIKTSYPRYLDFLQSKWIQAFEELGHP